MREQRPSWGWLAQVSCSGLLMMGLLLVSFAGAVRADEPLANADPLDAAADQSGPRALSRAFRSAARRATPAVVTILSYGQDNFLLNLMARQQPQGSDKEETETPEPDENQLTGLGSGVIVSEDGRVITNNHVIAGAKRVVVQLFDETEIEATEVRGDSDSDVATLKIDREGGFDCIEMGDSDALEIGDWVLAIGSPFRLEATVSAGIISAKNRSLRRIRRGRLIQTDAAINPGNSGGPLIDLDGRVIAISTAIATRNGGYQGVGFAIPVNQARWIAEELAVHVRAHKHPHLAPLLDLVDGDRRLMQLADAGLEQFIPGEQLQDPQQFPPGMAVTIQARK